MGISVLGLRRIGGGVERNGFSRPDPPDCHRPADRTPAGARHGEGAGRARGAADEFRKVEAGSVGLRQPKRLPSAVKVHSLAAMTSSTTASEVWCSYALWS